MKLAVTGTRVGMNQRQKNALVNLLDRLNPKEFHHGDCVGVDNEVADLVNFVFNKECKIYCHPPIEDEFRAFNNTHSISYEPLTYFARNRKMVNSCNALIVIPKESKAQTSGGTWYTHGYALKCKRKVFIIWPNGSVEEK